MHSLRFRLRSALIIGALIAGAFGTNGHANATPSVYFLNTGQTGAQTQIDSAHTTTWAFTATSDWAFGGGNIIMKDGSSTSSDVMLSVYQGIDATGSLVAQIDLSNTAFCTSHGGNCQSFNATPFVFVNGSHVAAPVSIANGQSYFVALTSTAPDAQSGAYFIKGLATSTFLDANGNALQGQTVSAQKPTNAPEPTALSMLATCLVGLSISRKRRGKTPRQNAGGLTFEYRVGPAPSRMRRVGLFRYVGRSGDTSGLLG